MNIKQLGIDILDFKSLSDNFQEKSFENSFNLTIIFRPLLIEGVVITSIGTIHCNKFSNFIYALKQSIYENPTFIRQINIQFANECTNFDITLVGIIALFKNSFQSIKFEIKLPFDEGGGVFAKFRDNLFLIRHWYLNITNQRLFSFTNETSLISKIKEPKFPSQLIFLITRTTFNDYFVSTNSTWEANKLFAEIDENSLLENLKTSFKDTSLKGDSQAETNYLILRNLLIKFNSKLEWKNNNRIFYQEYLRMMTNFDLSNEVLNKIENSSFENFRFKNFTKRGFKELEMSKLKGGFQLINSKLLEQPSFFIFLYCFLVNRNIGTAIIRDEERDGKIIINKVTVLLNRANELFEFTKNLFLGVREIARNIIDHTDTKTGVLTGRVYSSDSLFEIKGRNNLSELGSDLSKYANQLNELKLDKYSSRDDYFLDLTIFDEGTEGVINKTISNIKNLSTNERATPGLYSKDIEQLSNGEINFSDFFNTNEIKLHHHQIKTASHWGLIIFSNLINKNKGFFYASTRNFFDSNIIDSCHSYLKYNSSTKKEITPFDLGTYYNIILPLDRNQGLSEESKQYFKSKEPNFSANNYHSLLKYQYINSINFLNEKDEKILFQIQITNFIFNESSQLNYRNEIIIADLVGSQIKELRVKNKFFIPVLDFDNCSDDFDQSKLLRFLARLQMVYEISDLIISNVKADNIIPLTEIISLGGNMLNDVHFWNENHFVLLFSYYVDKDGRRNYYTDILGGFNYSDLKKLNSKLSSTHNTLFNLSSNNSNETFSENTLRGIENSQLFKSKESGIIQNFELILQQNNKSYFEISLENILNKNVDTKDGYNVGFKIEDTHFRLGSKIHITEFVYAKRIFQNSFYSDRFAFLTARYVRDNFQIKSDTTILGYGDYSQLLVNRTTEILKKVYENISINNDIISDIEELKLIKDVQIYENVIVLVPINTTFSTAIKIENLVREKVPSERKINIIPVNLILVSHNNLDDDEYVKTLNVYLHSKESNDIENKIYPYKLFHWTDIDAKNKIVTVETNPPDVRDTKQKYFITIPSHWALPDDCDKCFPTLRENIPHTNKDYRLLEKPLLETDKASVTPNLLLDIPENFKKENKSIEPYSAKGLIFLNENAHSSGHIEFRKTHYLNFIDPTKFYDLYKKEILIWANDCRKKLIESDPDIINKSILLISSSNNNNAYFIEFINRYIFKDSAIINHYEIREDYIENFEKFFKNDIKQAKYIFFVDDFIHSGNTFHLINDFVRYCNNNLINKGERDSKIVSSCTGLFTLINKTDNYSQNDIITLLQKTINDEPLFFSFYQWKDNQVKTEKCPICLERERYQLLAENSMLDTVKHFFLNKAKNLRIQESDSKAGSKIFWAKYHPLVNEIDDLPWSSNASIRSKELWDTFSNYYFPGKSYLKMLIQHSINELLSDDIEIREFIIGDTFDLNKYENIELNKKLLSLIIERLLLKDPFSIWCNSYNTSTQNIFRTVFKEIVIKIFTQQPFKNVKSIRERVFAWILIELTENIKAFIDCEKLYFKEFRYIKFLLRRATLLGSNFIIDKKTLNDFRSIFNKYPEERKLKIEKARKRKLNNLSEYLITAEENKKAIKNLIRKNKIIERDLSKQINANPLSISDLKDIQKSQNYKEKMDQYRSVISKLELLDKQLKLLRDQIKYVEQVKRNIIYKDISLREFSYFYVSLIKELTLNNESKVLSIERNIDSIIDSVKDNNENDFYFLLRLIKFENISLIKNSLDIILKEFIKNQSTISLENYCYLVREDIKKILKSALSHYRLTSFKQFFGIKDVSEWLEGEQCNYIIHLIYLLESLRKENREIDISNENFSHEKNDVPLEAKTQGLLRNLFRMICDPNFTMTRYENFAAYPYSEDKSSNGGFIAIKYRGLNKDYIPPSNIIITNTTSILDENRNEKERKKLIETEVDSSSMSYLMLNGLSNIENVNNGDIKFVLNDYPLKPWTVLDLSLKEKNKRKYWSVNRGAVFPTSENCSDSKAILYYQDGGLDIEYYFNEFSVIDESCNYLVFFRIAELTEKRDKVLNEGKAVLTFYTSQKEIPIERLRLMLLVCPDLNKFLKIHYEKDSLIAFIAERERVIESTRLTHGYSKFLGAFELVAKDNSLETSIKNETIDLFKNQLEAGPLLSNKFEKIKNDGVEKMKGELNRSFTYIKFSKTELLNEVEKIVRIVYQNRIYDTSVETEFVPNIVSIDLDEDFNFSFYLKIFKLLITEITINAKKSQNLIVDGSKYLTITLSNSTNTLTLNFENNSKAVIKEGERTRLMKGNFKYSSRGLSLISRICEVFSGSKPQIKVNENNTIFNITINIKNL